MGGWDLGERLALYGVLVGTFAIVTGVTGAYYHSAIRNPEARAIIVERLRAGGFAAHYYGALAGLLLWLDRRISAPSFAREGDTRGSGLDSLAICLSISYCYCVLAFLAAWAAGAPAALGVTKMVDVGSLLGWLPSPLDRIAVALLLFGLCIFLVRRLSNATLWSGDLESWISVRFGFSAQSYSSEVVAFVLVATMAFGGAMALGVVGVAAFTITGGVTFAGAVAGAVVVASAVAGTLTGACTRAWTRTTAGGKGLTGAWTGAVAGVSAGGLVFVGAASAVGPGAVAGAVTLVLFWALLPFANGVFDWISLTVSRWLGRWIVGSSDEPWGWFWITWLALLDLCFAVVFLFGIAWLLAFGIEALGTWFDVDLDLNAYIRNAAADPSVTGLWATFMVLSTLFPTAVHFALAIAAVLVSWFRSPLHRWVADQLDSGKEENFLLPTIFLTMANWTVPLAAASILILFGLGELLSLVGETLPEALERTALFAVGTADM